MINTKCRPIKIMLHNKDDRGSIMRIALKLSDTDEETVKGINLGYDMTIDERKAVDEKIAEANEKKKKNANSTLLVKGSRAPMGIAPEEGEEKESTVSMSPNIAQTPHNNTHINHNFFSIISKYGTPTLTPPGYHYHNRNISQKLNLWYYRRRPINRWLRYEIKLLQSHPQYTQPPTVWPPSLGLIQIFMNPVM